MAQQLAARSVAPDVCSQPPYAPYMRLQGFAPAEAFCSVYQATSTLPPISGCSQGNVLCSILSNLSSCDRAFISTVCSCIGAKPTVTISAPKTSSTHKSTTKTNSKSTTSKAHSESESVKTSPTTLATSTTSSMAISSSQVTLQTPAASTTSSQATLQTPAASTTSAAAPVCSAGLVAVVPVPNGAICQQRGTLTLTDPWDDVTQFGGGGGLATSVENCDQQCLDLTWCCSSSEFNPDTGACLLIFKDATTENFVADPTSPFIVSDVVCFAPC